MSYPRVDCGVCHPEMHPDCTACFTYHDASHEEQR